MFTSFICQSQSTFVAQRIESAVKQTLTETKGSIPDQNTQKDVKKNTKRTCLDFLLNHI